MIMLIICLSGSFVMMPDVGEDNPGDDGISASISESPTVILSILVVALLIAGMFMD
jgi:TRAP-type C4-dicarboxylate transport system permease large subunit